jgi:two-component system phosphate regulon response regulator PhoB
MSRILVVEDESAIAELVAINLRHAGFEVTLAGDAEQAQAAVDDVLPSLVILDWMLPGKSGHALARQWRLAPRTRDLPVIMLTARADEADRVSGLDAGADDYLTKPFAAGELLARLRVAQRHSARFKSDPGDPVFEAAGLRVDLARRHVTRDGAEIHLTPLEYKLLTTLVHHAGRVLTHRQILKEVWGPASVNETQYLRVYMAQLRHKIEKDPARPVLLLTETGVGYRLQG